MKIQNVFVGMIIAQAIMVNAAEGLDPKKCTSGSSHSLVPSVCQVPAAKFQEIRAKSAERCKGLAPVYPLVAAQKQSLLDQSGNRGGAHWGGFPANNDEEFQIGGANAIRAPLCLGNYFAYTGSTNPNGTLEIGYKMFDRFACISLGANNFVAPAAVREALRVPINDKGEPIFSAPQNVRCSFIICSINKLSPLSHGLFAVSHPWVEKILRDEMPKQITQERGSPVFYQRVPMGLFYPDGLVERTHALVGPDISEAPIDFNRLEPRTVAKHDGSYSPANANFDIDDNRDIATAWIAAKFGDHINVNFYVLLRSAAAAAAFEGPLKASNTVKDVINVLNERAAQFQNPADKDALRRAAFILCTAATPR